jgi:hypothetical protein
MDQTVDYYFTTATSLRSWSESGDIPRSRLDNLEVGICVELVLMSSVQESGKNVEILEFITPEYMKGIVNDDNLSSGAHCTCNICGEHSAPELFGKEDDLYCCHGELYFGHDFHVHKKCMNKINSTNKKCDCKVARAHFQNGSILNFNKSNIWGIP